MNQAFAGVDVTVHGSKDHRPRGRHGPRVAMPIVPMDATVRAAMPIVAMDATVRAAMTSASVSATLHDGMAIAGRERHGPRR